MAMNPQNVLSDLRMMSDQQLQQYAAMHKNDPFIFPLAFQESQMRKQMRSESQAMQPPAPKVADQALASMAAEPLPEEVGIGALPARNLEGMAAGGIVAFDEGGEVPRFSGTAGSFVGPQYDFRSFLQQMGISAQEFLASPPDTQKSMRDMFNSTHGAPQSAAPAAGATAAQTAAKPTTMWESIKQGLGRIRPGGLAAWDLGTYHGALNENEDAELAKRWKGAEAGYLTPGAMDQFTAGPYGGPNAGGADQGGKKAPPGPATPQVAMPQMPATKAPSIEDAKKLSGQFVDKEGIMKSFDDFNKMQDEGIAALTKAREEGKPAGKAYEEFEKTIRARADELASDKETARGEALLTAGLAVLGGSSPFALQNLSLATKGVEQYRDAMKDIKKAARENEKALADIEQSRRAEGREDWKEAQNYKEKAFDRQMKGRELGVNALMNLGIKDGEIASRAYDTAVQTNAAMERTLVQERGQMARTNAMINAPSGIEKIVQRMQTDPKFAASYRDYASIAPGVRGEYGALQQYMGPKGEMALKMMEAGGPEQQALAKSIRQRLQGMMLAPVDVPNALP
jgi:tetratricopeptide (TPR) repeat protein